MIRLYRPIEREFTVDGKDYVIALETGRGTRTGDVVITIRRKRTRGGQSFNLSDIVRRMEANAGHSRIPQSELFAVAPPPGGSADAARPAAHD